MLSMDSRIANSSGSDAAAMNQVGAVPNSVDRANFFAALFFLGCANGIAAKAIAAVHRIGWLHALMGLFDISAITLTACSLGLWLMVSRRERSVAPIDLAIGVVALALIALPIGGLSWIAVSGLALYVVLSTDAGLPLRRGALILLATTVPMFWSGLLFQFFTNFILEIDASLVGLLLDTERTGNMVRFADDSGYLVIFPACSSLANMSLAFLCWVTVSEFSGHRRTLSDLLWCLLVCGSVLAINVGRLSLMGTTLRHYDAIHSQIGDAVTEGLILSLALGWSFLGVRRELFSHT
jgi:hypothetical protein